MHGDANNTVHNIKEIIAQQNKIEQDIDKFVQKKYSDPTRQDISKQIINELVELFQKTNQNAQVETKDIKIIKDAQGKYNVEGEIKPDELQKTITESFKNYTPDINKIEAEKYILKELVKLFKVRENKFSDAIDVKNLDFIKLTKTDNNSGGSSGDFKIEISESGKNSENGNIVKALTGTPGYPSFQSFKNYTKGYERLCEYNMANLHLNCKEMERVAVESLKYECVMPMYSGGSHDEFRSYLGQPLATPYYDRMSGSERMTAMISNSMNVLKGVLSSRIIYPTAQDSPYNTEYKTEYAARKDKPRATQEKKERNHKLNTFLLVGLQAAILGSLGLLLTFFPTIGWLPYIPLAAQILFTAWASVKAFLDVKDKSELSEQGNSEEQKAHRRVVAVFKEKETGAINDIKRYALYSDPNQRKKILEKVGKIDESQNFLRSFNINNSGTLEKAPLVDPAKSSKLLFNNNTYIDPVLFLCLIETGDSKDIAAYRKAFGDPKSLQLQLRLMRYGDLVERWIEADISTLHQKLDVIKVYEGEYREKELGRDSKKETVFQKLKLFLWSVCLGFNGTNPIRPSLHPIHDTEGTKDEREKQRKSEQVFFKRLQMGLMLGGFTSLIAVVFGAPPILIAVMSAISLAAMIGKIIYTKVVQNQPKERKCLQDIKSQYVSKVKQISNLVDIHRSAYCPNATGPQNNINKGNLSEVLYSYDNSKHVKNQAATKLEASKTASATKTVTQNKAPPSPFPTPAKQAKYTGVY
jgi:hypothetical protein